MNIEQEYKIFLLENEIRKAKKSVWIFDYLIPLAHMILVVILALIKKQFQFEGSLDFLKIFLSNTKQNYLNSSIANLYVLTANVICVMTLLFSIIRLTLIPNLDETNKHKTINKVFIIMTVLLSYIYQLIIYFVTWSFGPIYQSEGLLIAVVKFVLPFYSYTYYTFKYETVSLYEWLTIPIGLSVTLVSHFSGYLFVVLASVYMALTQKIALKKIFCSFTILFFLLLIKNSFYVSENDYQKLKISMLSLGIAILITPALIKITKNHFCLSTVQNKVQQSYQILNSIKGENPSSEMNFTQFYQLYNNIISFSIENQQVKNSEIDEIRQKPIRNVSKRDLLVLIQKFLENKCRTTFKGNYFMQIVLLQVKLDLKHSQINILQELYTMNQDFSKERGNKTYLFQLFEKIIQKFGLFSQSQLEVARVIELNLLKEKFETKVEKLFQKLDVFWQKMSHQTILISSLDFDLDEVLKAMKDLQNLFKKLKISRMANFDKQEKIIELARIMLNSSLEEKKAGNEIRQYSDRIDDQVNLSFMILEDKKIKFLSRELMKDIGLEKNETYLNQPIKTFFGKDFSLIIEKMIENITPELQKLWIRIPISSKKGMMEIKRIKLIWFPSLEVKNKIMIGFSQDLQVQNDSLIIYRPKNDTVDYFNSNFIRKFNIDTDKMMNYLKNEEVFFNEIFMDVGTADDKSVKRFEGQNGIKCKIYLKKFIKNGFPLSIIVQVKQLTTTKFQAGSEYSLLKVIKQIDKTTMTQNNTISTNTKYTIFNCQTAGLDYIDFTISKNNDQDQKTIKQYANQKFFCKIPNHYEAKITQKQSQIQETQRWSYKYFIHIIFGLTLLGIFIFWALNYKLIATRIDRYTKQMSAIENTSQQYSLLYQAYGVILQRYYLQNHLMKYAPEKNVQWEAIDAQYVKRQQQILNNFITKHLHQVNEQPNNPIDFRLEFKHFSIKTNSKSTNLMDFAEKIKRHITDSSIKFLLQNYDNLRNLTIEYENSFSNQMLTSQIVAQTQKYDLTMMGIVTVCLIFVLLIVLKIEHSINMMYLVINQIEAGKIKQCIKKMSAQKRQIMSIFKKNSYEFKQSQKSKNLKQSLSHYSNVSKQPQSVSEMQQKSLLSHQLSKQNSKASFTRKRLRLNESPQIQCKSEADSSFYSSRKKLLYSVPEKRIGGQAILSRVIRKSFFFFLMFGFNALIYLDYSQLDIQKQGMMQLFQIKQNFHVAILHIKRAQVDAPMLPTLRHFYNKQIQDPYHKEMIALVTPISDKIILEEMKDFGMQATNILRNDMCIYRSENSSQNLEHCQSYLNGAVKRGFKESYDLYLRNGKIVGGQKLEDLQKVPCTKDHCPAYQTHLRVSELMDNTINLVMQKFNRRIKKGFETMVEQAQLMSVLRCCGLLGVGVMYYFYYMELSKKCMLAVKYFTIIPKSVMGSMKLGTFLRKNNVLQKLDVL